MNTQSLDRAISVLSQIQTSAKQASNLKGKALAQEFTACKNLMKHLQDIEEENRELFKESVNWAKYPGLHDFNYLVYVSGILATQEVIKHGQQVAAAIVEATSNVISAFESARVQCAN